MAESDPSTADARFPHFAASPALILMEVAGMLFFGLAAIGFTRRAEWTGDEFTTWLAASAALACFARLNYLFFPSLYSEWLYPADVMRLGAYVAANNRAQYTLKTYPETPAIEEALAIAVGAYDGMNIADLREDAKRVLAMNYPKSDFLRRAGSSDWKALWK